jgi:hypothetical protein
MILVKPGIRAPKIATRKGIPLCAVALSDAHTSAREGWRPRGDQFQSHERGAPGRRPRCLLTSA